MLLDNVLHGLSDLAISSKIDRVDEHRDVPGSSLLSRLLREFNGSGLPCGQKLLVVHLEVVVHHGLSFAESVLV